MSKIVRRCPFCGSTGKKLVRARFGFNPKTSDSFHAITCDHCGARGPESADREEARAGWNVRMVAK
jgi:Lar family restriction alleviation protein